MKRFYKKIDSTLELKTLDDLAVAEEKRAVGISNSGSLYKWNREVRRPEKINASDATSILQVTPEELDKIIETRGAFEIVEPVEEVPVPEPVSVELNAPIEEVKPEGCNRTHYNDLVALIQALHDDVKNLKEELLTENSDLKSKVDNLENAVNELRNFISLE